MPEDKPDLIILVHGTFANSNDDVGSRWWQSGSDFSQALNKRLEGKARCAGPSEVFHWSGKNSETERRMASHSLAHRFLELEREGQPYHVIAHSHGGNVLLSALFRCKGDLKFLRSWATVGTPFFRFYWLVFLPALWSLFLTALSFAGLFLVFFVGDPWSGLAVIGAAMVMQFASMNGVGPVAEMQQDERYRKKAKRKWNYRWISIWSDEDEAVTGLTAVSQFKSAYLPRAMPYPYERSFLAFYKPFESGWRKLFNWMINFSIGFTKRSSYAAMYIMDFFTIPFRNLLSIPLKEKYVTSVLRSMTLGDDSDSKGIKGVSHSPFDANTTIPSIPPELTALLVDRVNENLKNSKLLPTARSLLAKAAFGGMTPEAMAGLIASEITDNVLVHTSYFDIEKDKDSSIVEMLAIHIETSRGDSATSANPELMEWVDKFYFRTDQGRAYNERFVQDRIAKDPSILGLGDGILKVNDRIELRAGRLTLVLQEVDGKRCYEVEVQLGSIDESHLIRSIESWDIARKRYPEYDHTAVIVAENITSRFLNVISLFNGTIPLIVIQMNAVRTADHLHLAFTTVLDQSQFGGGR